MRLTKFLKGKNELKIMTHEKKEQSVQICDIRESSIDGYSPLLLKGNILNILHDVCVENPQ